MELKNRLKSLLPKIVLGIFYVAALVYYAGLLRSNSLHIHEPRTFGDSDSYLQMAKVPVFSSAFWTQYKPPVTSFFYKLVDADPNRIFIFQLWFTIACWAVLAFTVASVIRSYYLKPLAFALILAFSLSRDVFMWIPFIGSEAISFSFMALFIAAALWLISDWKAYKIPFLIVAAFFMAFSRDTAAFVLLIPVAIALPFLWFAAYRKHLLILIAAFLAIFGFSYYTGKLGGRFEYVFPIITSLRIFPNPAYTAFFKAQGMPIDPALVQHSDPNSAGYAKWDVAFALWGDPKQEPYRQWVKAHGAAAYIKFIWFFKADTLQKMFIEDGGRYVFFPDVYYYTATGYRPILKNETLADLLYPTRFGLTYFFLAQVLAAMAVGFAVMFKRKLWLVPIAMVLATYPQAFLIWNGDVNDIPRHSIGHNIMERLGLWILILFVLDFLSLAFWPILVRAWDKLRSRSKPAPSRDLEAGTAK